MIMTSNEPARRYRVLTDDEKRSHGPAPPMGIGYACNMAVRSSTGTFLCRFDADDVMVSDAPVPNLTAKQS